MPNLESRFKRAVSSGRLNQEESKRKALSFQENSNLVLDDEAMSDDDKNKIELIEGDMDLSYEPPQIKEIKNFQLSPVVTTNTQGEEVSAEKEETMIESFVIPESEGFSLDFIQKNRTDDKMRRNFLSRLTYQKVWLTPLQ